ncbi:hypothetical protein NIES4101_38600 [Calothrix sp. NIES-4101]|nr:hypothetical protein NIES4101_38600 [Calothrix sp. NIES-4101]
MVFLGYLSLGLKKGRSHFSKRHNEVKLIPEYMQRAQIIGVSRALGEFESVIENFLNER